MTIRLPRAVPGWGTVCGEPRPHVACSPTPGFSSVEVLDPPRPQTASASASPDHRPCRVHEQISTGTGAPLWHGMRADQRCPPTRRRHDQAQVIAQPFDLVMAHMVVTLASPKRGVPGK
jgi:hypothetical protein